MIPETFLDKGRQIVAEHKAQYKGVYYMKGGILGKVLDNPITQVISDVAATAFGQPELIPLINAGETAGGDLVKGESLGKSLGQGVLSGGESLAGQELAGAVGIGQGNTAFNSALGITGDNPAGTGLPDIGSIFSSGGSTPSAAATTGGGATGAPGSMTPPSSAGVGAGVSPGGTAGAAPAPASIGAVGPDVTLGDNLQNFTASNPSGPIDTSALGTLNSSLPSIGDLGGSTGTAVSGNDSFNSLLQANPASAGAASISNPSLNSSVAQNLTAGANPGITSGTLNSGNPFNVTPLDSSGIDALAAQTAAPASSSAPSSGSTFLKGLTGPVGQTGSNFINMLEANPGAVISAGGLGYSALEGNKPVSGQGALRSEANQLGAQGQQLESYLQSGTLPPGVSQALNQASESAKATIRSRYAQMGGSGSSAEQQELAAVDQNTQAQGAQIATQLLSQGISETGESGTLYNNIINSALQQDNALGSAFGNFAASLAGNSAIPKLNLSVAS